MHRTFRLVVAAFLSLALGLVAAPPIAESQASPTLKDQARTGLAVGGMTNGWDSEWPAGQHLQIASREFNAVTATMYMGWAGWLRPGEQNISHRGLDNVVQWAGDDTQVHGHVLVYPLSNQALPWFQNATDHEALLRTYVTEIASSNRGNIDVWHVVNEVFADPTDDRKGDYGFRNDYIEYQSIGSDYVEKAFEWADAADPDAVLIINEYGAEAEGPKADALYNYVVAKRAQGVPIEGVGFQMHIAGHGSEPDYASIRRNLARFADAGLRLYITELDVSAKSSPDANPPTVAERARQARIYEEIARIATEQPAVEALLLWDFVDNRSWLHPAITSLNIPDTPWHVAEDDYTFPTPWSGGRDEPAVANDNYDALLRGLQNGAADPLDGPEQETDVPAGPAWVTSRWEPDSSYLGRDAAFDGDWQPQDATTLLSRSAESEEWWSMQWVFEPAGDNTYRIRSRWGADGYLTRQGISNGTGWDPGPDVHLHAKDTSWSSQLWQLQDRGDGSVRIVNAWAPETGVLTRDGLADGAGGFTPGSTVSLHAPNDTWSSQFWDVYPVRQ